MSKATRKARSELNRSKIGYGRSNVGGKTTASSEFLMKQRAVDTATITIRSKHPELTADQARRKALDWYNNKKK